MSLSSLINEYRTCSGDKSEVVLRLINYLKADYHIESITPDIIHKFAIMTEAELQAVCNQFKTDVLTMVKIMEGRLDGEPHAYVHLGIMTYTKSTVVNDVLFITQSLNQDMSHPTRSMNFEHCGNITHVCHDSRGDFSVQIGNTSSIELNSIWFTLIKWSQIIDCLKSKLEVTTLQLNLSEDAIYTVFPANFPEVPPIEIPASKHNYCKNVFGSTLEVRLSEEQVSTVNKILRGDRVLIQKSDRDAIYAALNSILINELV